MSNMALCVQLMYAMGVKFAVRSCVAWVPLCNTSKLEKMIESSYNC